MRQVTRTLTEADDGWLVGHRVLICDRDAKWSAPVRERLGEAGIHVVQTPYQAPNANAYAARFVRSIKQECLNRVIPFGERHFRRTMAEYIEHDHWERNHQGLANELIERAPSAAFVDVCVSGASSITPNERRERGAVVISSASARRWDSSGCSITTNERRDRIPRHRLGWVLG
jgi:hypothetical protein